MGLETVIFWCGGLLALVINIAFLIKTTRTNKELQVIKAILFETKSSGTPLDLSKFHDVFVNSKIDLVNKFDKLNTHMSRYSAVLESQERLIKTINALIKKFPNVFLK